VNAFLKAKTFVRNFLLVTCGCAWLAIPAFGTPTEEITRAIQANGVSDVSQAHARQVVKAFRAVTFRVQPRDLPDYVIAAINLRPDFAPNFVAVAVKATVKQSDTKPELLCALIERIVGAAIAANPSTAVSIAKAAASAAPTLRRCVINAAIAAAPQARDQILAAATQTTPLAFLTYSASDEVRFSSWSGALNSANIFDVGNSGGVINSPEQPPSN
jgi:urease accessory protein UreF